MSRAKNFTNDELFPSVTNMENYTWITEYRPNASSIMSSNIDRFLRLRIFNNRVFSSFTDSDVLSFHEYMDQQKKFSDSTKNNYINAIISFRNFLREKYPKIFSETFLDEIDNLRYLPRELNKITPIPLSLQQIYCIRKYCEEENNPITLFIFEVFFQLGIKKKDIHICNMTHINNDNNCFEYQNIKIPYNSYILSLLQRFPNILSEEIREHMVSPRLQTVTNYLIRTKNNGEFSVDRPLSYEDINKTHELFFFTCPICFQSYENLSSNWVLARIEGDNIYRLVCKECKGVKHEN